MPRARSPLVDKPGLWHAATVGGAYGAGDTGSPSTWTAQDGLVAHVAGSSTNLLLFDYPVTGAYEFSAEAYAAPWAESGLTHNGMGVAPFSVEGIAAVFPIGRHESLTIPWRLARPNGFNRVTAQISPEKVRYLVNGHLCYEDVDPGSTSPWLGLLSYGDRHSVWRRLTLAGHPLIPREAALAQGDRLDGWISSFYNEIQPRHRTEAMTDPSGNINRLSTPRLAGSATTATPRKGDRTVREPIDLDAHDWAASAGVIHGRRVIAGAAPRGAVDDESFQPGGPEALQSRLYYFRPLRDGDELSYEFFHQPDLVMVHPALDRLAFLLEPDGVRVHWMTAGRADVSRLPADNAVVEPDCRRGPSARPVPGRPLEYRQALHHRRQGRDRAERADRL